MLALEFSFRFHFQLPFESNLVSPLILLTVFNSKKYAAHNESNAGLPKSTSCCGPDQFDTTDVKYPKKMKDAGSHSHAVTAGVTQEIGIDETRPVNYGVNYIIKL